MCHNQALVYMCGHRTFHRLHSCLGNKQNKNGDKTYCKGLFTAIERRYPHPCLVCIKQEKKYLVCKEADGGLKKPDLTEAGKEEVLSAYQENMASIDKMLPFDDPKWKSHSTLPRPHLRYGPRDPTAEALAKKLDNEPAAQPEASKPRPKIKLIVRQNSQKVKLILRKTDTQQAAAKPETSERPRAKITLKLGKHSPAGTSACRDERVDKRIGLKITLRRRQV